MIEEPEEQSEFQRLKKIVKDAHSKRSDWRKEAVDSYNIVNNHQWSEKDAKILEEQNRPAISFNRVAPLINAVCGLEINNRQMVAYLPRKIGAAEIDESRTNCAKWVRDRCDAEDEESEAFRDLTICGEGWTETRMDFDINPQGMIIEERVDPLEMGANEEACKANYSDASLLYRVREIDSREAAFLVGAPDLLPEALHARWLEINEQTPADGGEGFKTDYPNETRQGIERSAGRRKVRLVQIQWWEREPAYLVAVDGAQNVEELDEEEFNTFQSRVQAMQEQDAAATAIDPIAQPTAPTFKHARVMKRCYYEAFLGSALFAKKKMELQEFTFKAMTGRWDRKKRCFFGMVRDMVDPQRWANKWLSQTMNIMNTNAKGGIMAEKDAFENTRKAEKDWSDPTKIVWVKPGTISKNKIKERQPVNLPQGLAELMQFALSSLRDVTGVNLELLGQADREQAAILETQRRQAAMTTLAYMFDSLRRYRKQQGRLTLKFVEMLPEGTLYYILEDDKYQYVPLIKQGDINEYDVIIDQTPTSPDQKNYVWNVTTQLLSSGIQFPPTVIAKLLKYSPYPASVAQEIANAMGLGETLPPEMLQQKLQQAEQALQVMEKALAAATDEKELEHAKLAVEEFRAETERLKVRVDAIVKGTPEEAQPEAEPESLN